VRNLLAAHKQALEELAKLLLDKEVVERPQLQAILNNTNGSLLSETGKLAGQDQPEVACDHKL
jgi:hypothetical protein